MTRTGRTTWTLARTVAALAALVPLASQTAGLQRSGDRAFRVPMMTSDERAEIARIDSYLERQEWTPAIEALQTVIEEHRDAVLPEDFGTGEPSQFTVYPGAAQWALDTLANAPSRARDAYRDQFGTTARLALESVRESGSVASLVELTRRWPITDAAIEAWILGGDLELERGDVRAALYAWERARWTTALCGLPSSAAVQQRLQLGRPDGESIPPGLGELASLLEDDGRGGFRLARAGEGRGPVPMRSADTWERTGLDLGPMGHTGGRERYNLFPVLAGDKLLVNTTLRLSAYDPWSSELLWETPEPEGWDSVSRRTRSDLFEGIDDELNIVAPAVGGGVVVCAMQVPHESEDQEYQGIPIVTSMPERRLFAFDLETGAPLWNHAPPKGWDGEGGTFEQRMTVSAAPIVVGTRILVSSHRLRGRIDFHAACYDLFTGRRLWSTGLVSGQGDLNMFGRQVEEFCGAPPVAEGDRVIVQTQLGTVACLDLFTGHIRWQTRYEQIPLEKNFGWGSTERDLRWRNAPPVVANGVVVSAPSDSYSVAGFDLETGAALWSFDYDRLPAQRSREDEDPVYNTLLGAEGDTIFVGGNYVSALQRPGGLRSRPGSSAYGWFEPRWSVYVGRNTTRLPRPVLGADEVVVPTYDERLVVDRATGERLVRKTTEWMDAERGNVLIGKGVVFTVGNRRVAAAFDWDVLIARAEVELEKDPEDLDVTMELGELLLRRARSLYHEGDPVGSLTLLARAKELLEPNLVGGGGQQDPRVAEHLHAVLRAEAESQRVQANGPRALTLLVEALALAADPIDVRDTLLEQEEILRLRDREEWLQTLGDLEARCADLVVPPERLQGSTSWLVGEALLTGVTPGDHEVPVGLWVLFTRAESNARSGRREDALADLHAAIERYGDRTVSTGLTVADIAEARIARRLELDGPRVYEPFEERAAALFTRAVEGRDPHLLGEVARLYPHSAAARAAERENLAWALESGDAALACALAFPTLSAEPRLTTDDVDTLLRVAALLAEEGNLAFEREALARVAADDPRLVASGHPRYAHAPVGELAAAAAREAGERAGAARTTPLFDTSVTRTREHRGKYEVVGRLPASNALLFRHMRDLAVFASDSPTSPRWSHQFAFPLIPHRIHRTPERVVAGGGESVVALDAASGDEAWTWEAEEEDVLYVSGSEGIVVVLVAATDRVTHRSIERLQALDAGAGTELWSLELGEQAGWLLPLCGEGRVVLLRERWGPNSSSALVIDLLRGRVERELDLGDSVLKDSWKASWIEEGRLIVPFFSASRQGHSRVASYRLDQGRQDWVVEVATGSELSNVLVAEGRSYLVVLPISHEGGADAGYVTSLEATQGRTRRVAQLQRGDDPMIGADPGTRVELSGPHLFVHSRREGTQRTPVTMLDLVRGTSVWTYHLPVAYEDLYGTRLPEPAVSDSTVAIAYTTIDKARLMRDEARLELVDRMGGFRRDSRVLSPQLCKAESLGLFGLGEALLVVGEGRYAGKDISRIEVMEKVR